MKNFEALSREQFNRTLYAATLCKQMAGKCDVDDSLSKTHHEAEEDCITTMNVDCSEDHNPTGIDSTILELQSKVRYLPGDIDGLVRCAKILTEAGFIDDGLRIANGEL